MKTFFLSIILTLGLVVTTPVEAQFCSPVTSANYASCCSTYTPENTAECSAVYASTVEGQVNSGTQGTNALGGSGALGTAGNPGAPQSGSEVLKECSAIKFKSLLDILIWVKCIITSVLIPLIFAAAFLFFLWNVLQFMRSAENTQKEEAKQRMGWGIIALFVMVGVWGIITILSGTLGIKASVPFLQTQEYLNPASASK
ncbi:pilin [Patescibacteria group bacterium]|nr:pilin [Patescibacteria group bacterium]